MVNKASYVCGCLSGLKYFSFQSVSYFLGYSRKQCLFGIKGVWLNFVSWITT